MTQAAIEKSNVLVSDAGTADSQLQLPYDRLRTPNSDYAKQSISRSIGFINPEYSESPLAYTRFLTAICTTLLYRLTGQSDIRFSSCLLTEDQTEYWLSQAEVSGSTVFDELVTQFAHAANERVTTESTDDVLVTVEHASESVSGTAVESLWDTCRPQLWLYVVPGETEDIVGIRYNAGLFHSESVERILDYTAEIIRFVSDSPGSLLADINLFTVEEHSWLDTKLAGPVLSVPDRPVYREFEDAVRKYPASTAVRYNETAVDYFTLNSSANQLAHYLADLGVSAGDRVAVCIQPSVDIAVALLAILKIGATYVPINPAHPQFRIDAILEDTNPARILSHATIDDVLDSQVERVVHIDRLQSELAEYSTSNPDIDVGLDDSAYVYYTSGTTGKPKGVLVKHANMLNMIHTSRDRFSVGPDVCMPAVASYSFSISMFEIMTPLTVGGTLVVLDREHVMDPSRMADTLANVTMFHIGPSLLKNILRHIKDSVADFSRFDGVRHASSGGDMVPPEVCRDLQAIFTKAELFVFYGCSEISLMGCAWEFPDGYIDKSFVGAPFRNTRLRILDDDGNQVPVGTTGDVCFGGPGVVDGYLNRPEQTNSLFFAEDGVRFYRTGDRGRLDRAGHLELLGRRDFQIQIRGMRVELAEIDYHLRTCPGVRDGVVAAKVRPDGEKVLVGYAIPDDGESFDVEELRTHMQQHLPDYMVPTFFMTLTALPLNHNLKVDRNALPDVVLKNRERGNEPQTPLEKTLARVWEELLGLDFVGVDDNFMALGGDSILAMQMIMTVEKECSCKINGLDVLRESLAELANIIARQTGIANESSATRGSIIASRIHKQKSLYFGPTADLYGIFLRPEQADAGTPVLICPPIGYEYRRCHFLFHVLAADLADAGHPSLRFDYYGSGDSLGEDHEASVARWRADIAAALQELRALTGRDEVCVVSSRLSVMLAVEALDATDDTQWICWDPVLDGAHHYRELRNMTDERARDLLPVRNLRKPHIANDFEELAGVVFTKPTIEDVQRLRINADALISHGRVSFVLSADCKPLGDELRSADPSGALRVVDVSDACDWYSSRDMSQAITHKSIMHAIRDLVSEGSR